MAKKALGKGLGALIGAPTAGPVSPPPLATPNDGDVVQEVPIASVVPSPLQPRTEFAPEQLQELMNSIREHGIIQPLIVRLVADKHELIAGERRWRASQLLELEAVPVIVRKASDRDVLEMALIENLQREDLNPIEEALAYARLKKDFKMRQDEIAERVGKNRATVANSMRLLDLDHPVQELISLGEISVGHGKVILSLKGDHKDHQIAVAEKIAGGGLSVRATEKLVSEIINPEKPKPKGNKLAPQLAAAINNVEGQLREHLQSGVNIKHDEKKGKLEIEYFGTEDLNRILAILGIEDEV